MLAAGQVSHLEGAARRHRRAAPGTFPWAADPSPGSARFSALWCCTEQRRESGLRGTERARGVQRGKKADDETPGL